MGGCPCFLGGKSQTNLKGVLPMADPKFGPNEYHRLVVCPRCADTVPVFIRKVITVDSYHGMQQKEELHCRECAYYAHKDGTYIKELKEALIND
jgi:hypothetical protein